MRRVRRFCFAPDPIPHDPGERARPGFPGSFALAAALTDGQERFRHRSGSVRPVAAKGAYDRRVHARRADGASLAWLRPLLRLPGWLECIDRKL